MVSQFSLQIHDMMSSKQQNTVKCVLYGCCCVDHILMASFIHKCSRVFPLAALEGVQEGLESLSVYVASSDVIAGDNLSQRSDHHNTSSSEVVS